MTELDWPEILLRLGVATLAGSAIGLNRDLHGKPIGLKTLGIVGLSTATVVLLAAIEATFTTWKGQFNSLCRLIDRLESSLPPPYDSGPALGPRIR